MKRLHLTESKCYECGRDWGLQSVNGKKYCWLCSWQAKKGKRRFKHYSVEKDAHGNYDIRSILCGKCRSERADNFTCGPPLCGDCCKKERNKIPRIQILRNWCDGNYQLVLIILGIATLLVVITSSVGHF